MKVKKYVSCIIVLMLVISIFTISAFADDGDSVGEPTDVVSDEPVESEPTIIIQQTTLEDVGVAEIPAGTILRVSASDTSGLHSIVLGLIGDYNPIVTDHVYSQSGNYTSHHIEVTPDWSWIASCFVFCIVLYSSFRLVGSIFSGK